MSKITFFSTDSDGYVVGEEYYTTVAFANTPDGVVSDWWVTKDNFAKPFVVGTVSYPTAALSAGFALTSSVTAVDALTVTNFLSSVYSGAGGVSSAPSARSHTHLQLEYHYARMVSDPSIALLERTAGLYSLAKQMYAGSPASLLLQVEEEVDSVRTIHDRIYRARLEGLL